MVGVPMVDEEITLKITLKNLYLGLKYQLPLRRFICNFFITKNARGLFHPNSHISQGSGELKICYNHLASAVKAGESMERKYGGKFRPYKCFFCDGFHIGKNRVV